MNEVTNTTVKTGVFKVPSLEDIYIELIKIYWWLGKKIKRNLIINILPSSKVKWKNNHI